MKRECEWCIPGQYLLHAGRGTNSSHLKRMLLSSRGFNVIHLIDQFLALPTATLLVRNDFADIVP